MKALAPLLSTLALLWALPAAATPPIVAAAAQARAQAEADLGRFRQERLEGQTALVRRVDRAQARLSAAREAVAAAQARLDAARAAAVHAADAAAERQARLDELDRQLARAEGVEARLDALQAAARGRRATGEVHDRQGRPTRVTLLHIGPLRYAVGETDATVGLVAGEPLRIGGPRLSPEQARALRRFAAGETAVVPVDVSGELASAAAAEPWSVRRWLAAGGPFVWPILALGIAALLVALDRARVAWVDRPPSDLAERVFAALDRGDPDGARALVTPPRTPLARVLALGLRDRTAGVLEAALAAEDVRLDRGLRLLAVFAAVAPLLGLLGTVSGMIGTFDVIAVHGTGEPRLLSGGIARALTTTQLGLMVAVPTLLIHALFGRLAERERARLEAAAARLADGAGSATGEKKTPEDALLPIEPT